MRYGFALAVVGLVASLASEAAAQDHVPKDRVVVLRVSAQGTAAALADELEDHLNDAVKKSEKIAVGEQVPADQAPPPQPETEAEARTIAEIHGSQFLVAAKINAAGEERVVVELRVESVEHERYDTARFEAYHTRLGDAVRAVIPLALRDEGLGAEGVELTRAISAGEGVWSKDGSGQPPTETEEPAASNTEPPDPQDPPEDAQPQAAEPSVLSEVGPLSLGAGLALRPLLSSAGDGGVLIGPVAQGRYRLVDGFSVHANAGLMWGAASALELSVGAAFLPLLLDSANLRVGASLEVGAYFSFSGSRDPAFLLRASPALFWAVTKNVGIDVGVLEFGWISGADALTLGGHVRLRYSF